MTLNLMNGLVPSKSGGWETWMEDRARHEIALRDPSMIRSPELDLMELSEGDLEVLEEVWAKFGHLDKFQLRDYTHSEACSEWEDPEGSSKPISLEVLFKALGYSAQGVHSAVEHLRGQAHLNVVLS